MQFNIKSGQKLSIREQQLVLLEIMKQFHVFCAKFGIHYALLYGTLLGAVRHKGFIPWDNDLDIGIPRPDYDRLEKILSEGVTIGPHIYHLSHISEQKYDYPFMRLCDDRTIVLTPYLRNIPNRMGVWIDVFPIDGIPEKKLRTVITRARLFLNIHLNIVDTYTVRGKKDLLNIAGSIVCMLFPHPKKREKTIDNLLRKTSFNASERVGIVLSTNGEYTPLSPSSYLDPVLMSFEDTKFYCPRDWDTFLKDCYNDYMELPPEDQRTLHGAGCYWV